MVQDGSRDRLADVGGDDLLVGLLALRALVERLVPHEPAQLGDALLAQVGRLVSRQLGVALDARRRAQHARSDDPLADGAGVVEGAEGEAVRALGGVVEVGDEGDVVRAGAVGLLLLLWLFGLVSLIVAVVLGAAVVDVGEGFRHIAHVRLRRVVGGVEGATVDERVLPQGVVGQNRVDRVVVELEERLQHASDAQPMEVLHEGVHALADDERQRAEEQLVLVGVGGRRRAELAAFLELGRGVLGGVLGNPRLSGDPGRVSERRVAAAGARAAAGLLGAVGAPLEPARLVDGQCETRALELDGEGRAVLGRTERGERAQRAVLDGAEGNVALWPGW